MGGTTQPTQNFYEDTYVRIKSQASARVKIEHSTE